MPNRLQTLCGDNPELDKYFNLGEHFKRDTGNTNVCDIWVMESVTVFIK